MSLLVRRCLNRSHQLEQYVETWQIDHKGAVYAGDLEELVEECLEIAPLLRRAWDRAVERLFDEGERSEKVFAGEEVIRGAISRVVRVFGISAKLIESAERAGFSIDGVGRFRDGLRDLERLEQEAENQWPPMDSQQMRDSLAAYQRGDYQSAADVLRELQGDCARTD